MHTSLLAAFISHGGGPLPLLGDPAHASMVQALQDMARQMPKPAAVVVVSAHWETSVPTVTTGAQPPLIYDYGGFPAESYTITYPAPGNPALAQRVLDALHAHGLPAQGDGQRGFDHGVFVPMKLMYPEADIPCVQLSLGHDLDPARHVRLGDSLAGLGEAFTPEAPLLLLGSGFSFHNLRAFFSPSTQETQGLNQAFEDWLVNTCMSRDMTEAQRAQALVDWALAPGARYCHPREEHLLPLHVCYGAMRAPAAKHWRFDVLGKQASTYLWAPASV